MECERKLAFEKKTDLSKLSTDPLAPKSAHRQEGGLVKIVPRAPWTYVAEVSGKQNRAFVAL